MSQTSTQDKTEKATPKRISDARKQGQVPRSRELNTAVVLGAAVAAIAAGGASLAAQALQLMRDMLSIAPDALADPLRMPWVFAHRVGQGFVLVGGILLATLVAALVAPALIGGFLISMQNLQPKYERIDPLAGLKRMVSGAALVELIKGLLKFGLIGSLCAWFIWRHLHDFSALATMDLQLACAALLKLSLALLFWGLGALLLIAAIDAPYQLWHHFHQLRMSKQEVLDEYKQSEGRPEVKGRIRRLQYEMSRRRMLDAVPNADVVINNPSHYAVALRYKSGQMRAPVLVAKGRDELALAIREAARAHRIPEVSAPPLARALYRNVRVDKEIPHELYQAVALVLTYIYQLRHWKRGQPWPQLQTLGEIPGGAPDP